MATHDTLSLTHFFKCDHNLCMRVVCLVPSWTETLIAAGVNVVGRTRFCVHPAAEVQKIAVVGGTKDVKWDLVADLRPDVIVLDKEENTKEIHDESPYPCFVTHVTSVDSMCVELEKLSKAGFSPEKQWQPILEMVYHVIEKPGGRFFDWTSAVVEKFGEPLFDQKVCYWIWKKPWMSVSSETYIGSVLDYIGLQNYFIENGNKYPVCESFPIGPGVDHLFSSEPYPFSNKKSEIAALNVSGALVDGEVFSWYGIRSLRFLYELKIRAQKI